MAVLCTLEIYMLVDLLQLWLGFRDVSGVVTEVVFVKRSIQGKCLT